LPHNRNLINEKPEEENSFEVAQVPDIPQTRTPSTFETIIEETPVGQGELLKAAAIENNLLVAGAERLSDVKPGGGVDYDFDKPGYLKGTILEDNQEILDDIDNQGQADYYIRRETERQERLKIIDEGGAMGLIYELATGVADPTIFIPGSLVFKAGKAGFSVGKSALSVGAGAAVGNGIQRAIIESTQETNPDSRVLQDTVAGFVMGSAFGAGFASLATRKITKARARIKSEEERILDLKIKQQEVADIESARQQSISDITDVNQLADDISVNEATVRQSINAPVSIGREGNRAEPGVTVREGNQPIADVVDKDNVGIGTAERKARAVESAARVKAQKALTQTFDFIKAQRKQLAKEKEDGIKAVAKLKKDGKKTSPEMAKAKRNARQNRTRRLTKLDEMEEAALQQRDDLEAKFISNQAPTPGNSAGLVQTGFSPEAQFNVAETPFRDADGNISLSPEETKAIRESVMDGLEMMPAERAQFELAEKMAEKPDSSISGETFSLDERLGDIDVDVQHYLPAEFNDRSSILVNSLGYVKFSKFISPNARMFNSESFSTRDINRGISRTAYKFTDELEGKSTMAIEDIADSADKVDSIAAHSLMEIARRAVKAGDFKNQKEFYIEHSRAINTGGHPNKFVQEAYLVARKVYNPKIDKAIELGIVKKEEKIQFYAPHIYDEVTIAKNPEGFKAWVRKVITRELTDIIANATPAKAATAQDDLLNIEHAVTSTINNVQGVYSGQEAYAVISGTNSLKGRVMNDLYDEFENGVNIGKSVWLVKDNSPAIMMKYAMSMNRKIAMKEFLIKRFGEKEASRGEVLLKEEISKEYDTLRELNPERFSELQKSQENDIKDLEGVIDRFYGISRDEPLSLVSRMSAAAQNLATMLFLGKAPIASLVEFGRIFGVMAIKNSAVFGNLKDLIFNLNSVKGEMEDFRAMQGFMDSLFASTVMARIGAQTEAPAITAAERLLKQGASGFIKISGLPKLTDFQKMLVGMEVMSEVPKLTRKLLDGVATPNEIALLSESGINSRGAQLIMEQFDKHATTNAQGRTRINIEQWDADARTYMSNAVTHRANVEITTPGIGQVPLFFSTFMGKLWAQFRRFSFAANETITGRLAQGGSGDVAGQVMQVTTMLGIAVMVGHMRGVLQGKETENDIGTAVMAAINNSGLFGLLADGLNAAEKLGRFSNSDFSVKGAIGLPEGNKFQSVDVSGVLGASLQAVNNTVDLAKKIVEGEAGDLSQQQIGRMLPPMGLWFIQAPLLLIPNSDVTNDKRAKAQSKKLREEIDIEL